MERLPTPVFWTGEFHGLYIVHGVAKSQTQLNDSDFHFHPISHSYKPRCGSFQCPPSSALEYFISLQHSREPTGKWGECTQPPLPTGRKRTGEGGHKQGGRNTRLGREKLMGHQCIISMEETRKQKMVCK